MSLAAAFLLVPYFCSFALLACFAVHRLRLMHLLRRAEPAAARRWQGALPEVTVQLPLYNERYVVERLLAAVSRLQYPRERLEVQVLDDSTDGTSALVARGLAQLRAAGIAVQHLRRGTRDGYKAGALAYGLERARGEFVLILDADFVPQPSLLYDLLPPMQDQGIAMVQARWTHLNREANALTRAQATLLDGHFLLETAGRAAGGLFFNFHGTAGLWRRSAICAAGGWSADTLTEDLDLSFRAQLRGWRFAFLPEVAVPAELPTTLRAFRQQQARWAEGTVATARKHGRAILTARIALRGKCEAIAQLTCHSIYPATLVVALTALPATLYRRAAGLHQLFWLDLLLALGVIVPTRWYYRAAARCAGTRAPGLREMPQLMFAGSALAISNTRAVLRGLWARPSEFQRTPKQGAFVGAGYRIRASFWLRSLDGSLAAYLLLSMAIALGHGLFGAAPAFAFLALAFGNAAWRG